MNREDFTAAWEAAYTTIIAALQSLPPELLQEPLAEGKWSLRDLAAHLIFWDKITLRALEARFQGQDLDWNEYSDWDGLNRQAADEMRTTPLKRMISEWQLTHGTIEEALSRVPEELLFERGEIPQWLHENVLDHYVYHAGQVEEWVETIRKEGKAGPSELPVINR
ncbi:MAG: ClbS/DfsB family four-helix bundle protein [Calditrichota bacterium]